MGTGWLVRPDVLVTAGHCVYDWSQGEGGLGRAVNVKAYIGYNGKQSVGTESVQFRHGSQIVTTAPWLKSPENRTNDVSFIKLANPFNDPASSPLVPFKFSETPGQGEDILGVVGYPGDMTMLGEKGAQMYEEFGSVKYNIITSAQHMLNYKISSYAGTYPAGQDFLRLTGFRPIRIAGHPPERRLVHWSTRLWRRICNSASPIMGKYGNPYRDYIAAFNKPSPKGTGISSVPLLHSEDAMDDAEEGFFDVLKAVVKVAAPLANTVLQVAAPAMGPLGGPISVVAGAALSMASKVAESSMAESSFGESISGSGTAERAILGEAAFQTILTMNRTTVQESGIFDTMKSVWSKLGPMATQLGPKLLPAVLEPALHLALDEVQKMSKGPATESSFSAVSSWTLPPASFKKIKVDQRTQAFADSLAATKTPTTGDAEGFFDIIGDVIQTGMKIIPVAAPALIKLVGSLTESGMEPTQKRT